MVTGKIRMAVASLIVSFAPVLPAATIEQIKTFDISDIALMGESKTKTDNLIFDSFDTSLGTLTGGSLVIFYQSEFTGTFTAGEVDTGGYGLSAFNLSTGPSDVFGIFGRGTFVPTDVVEAGNSFDLSGFEIYNTMSDDFLNSQGGLFGRGNVPPASFFMTSGPGQVSLLLKIWTELFDTDAGGSTGQFSNHAFGTLTLTYEYEPATAPVPIPAPLLLLGSSLAALGLTRRRWN